MRHRLAGALVACIVLIFLGLVFADGSVIYPHDNSRELFAPAVDAPERLTNRKFSDLSSTIVPSRSRSWSSRDEKSGNFSRRSFITQPPFATYYPTRIRFIVHVRGRPC